MMCIKQFKLIGLSFFLASFSAIHAANIPQHEPTVVITFSETAENIVHTAYKPIIGMEKPLSKMIHMALEVLSNTDTSEDEYRNSKFQAQKYKITHKLDHAVLSVAPFLQNEIIIDIPKDGNDNHLTFKLPRINVFISTSIDSVAHAEEAIIKLKGIRNEIDSILPSDTTSSALTPFINPDKSKSIEEDNLTHVIMSQTEDSQTLIYSFVRMHDKILDELQQMLILAYAATDISKTEEDRRRLNEEYESKYYTFASSFYGYAAEAFQKIKLFNDILLVFPYQGITRKYYFPKIDLYLLNLDSDTILDFGAALSTLQHIFPVLDWSMNWSVTGSRALYDFRGADSSKRLTPLNLKALNLSAKEMGIVQKSLLNR